MGVRRLDRLRRPASRMRWRQGSRRSRARVAEEFTFRGEARPASSASYARRELDWTLQSNSAAQRDQPDLQAAARRADPRGDRQEGATTTTRCRWPTHSRSSTSFKATASAAAGKETTVGFYTLMKREAEGAVRASAFQLAFDVAKKAERALQHELGDSVAAPTSSSATSTAPEGLLAGEKLLLRREARWRWPITT